MSSDPASLDFARAIDFIEETYEYMLAYAAQGRVDDKETSGGSIRAYLERSDLALGVIATAKLSDDASQKFLEVMQQDAAKARAAIRLVLARPAMTSQTDRQSQRLDPFARAADGYLPARRDPRAHRLLRGTHFSCLT